MRVIETTLFAILISLLAHTSTGYARQPELMSVTVHFNDGSVSKGKTYSDYWGRFYMNNDVVDIKWREIESLELISVEDTGKRMKIGIGEFDWAPGTNARILARIRNKSGKSFDAITESHGSIFCMTGLQLQNPITGIEEMKRYVWNGVRREDSSCGFDRNKSDLVKKINKIEMR